jgi:hypothetical protein
MYNPLQPWNAWLALASQPARFCLATQTGILRGIANGAAIAETETDRVLAKNVGVAEEQIPAAARKSKKHSAARKAVAVAAKRDRRKRHRVRFRSGRVAHRAKKVQKRRAA